MRHEPDAGHVFQRGAVVAKNTRPGSDSLGQDTELTSADGCQYIAQTVIMSNQRMLIMRCRVARLRRQKSRGARLARRPRKRACRHRTS